MIMNKLARLLELFWWSKALPIHVTHAALASIILSHSVFGQEAPQGVFLREEFGGATITLAGSIRSGDADIVQDVLRRMIEKGTNPWVVLLNNDGGSVVDALKIGRMARSLDLLITARGRCYSSCALVFAGGSRRSVLLAEIGLHRPFFATSSDTVAPSQDEIEGMFSSIETYLREMNVSQVVFDAMLNTAPESMLIVSDKEEIYRLFGEDDPVFSEISNIDRAEQYGISMRDFLEVEAIDFIGVCDEILDDLSEISSCYTRKREATLWKLPQSNADAVMDYLDGAYKECKRSEADSATLAADARRLKLLSLERLSPEYQRQILSHPIRKEFRACVRSAMERYR